MLDDIHTFSGLRKKGTGTGVLRAILEHNAPDSELHLSNIQPGEARDWWVKRGAKIFNSETGEDGTITRADFERSNPARNTEAAAGAQRGVGADGQTPRAYASVALEERIKAALTNIDNRPELIRQGLNDKASGAKLDPANPPAVPWEYVTDSETAQGVIREVTSRFQTEIDTQRRGVRTTAQAAHFSALSRCRST